ncbi:SPT48 protein, partial [Scytalopus superciliaris]|nr:SPT48 protein [Scytalopus superciliaris]
HPSLLKKMCMPVVRGLESNNGSDNFEEEYSNSFLKFYLLTPPVGVNYPLIPHQIVVPLVGSCLGFVSPTADAEQQPSVGRTIECLVDYSDTSGPHPRRESPARPQEETSPDRQWKSGKSQTQGQTLKQIRSSINFSRKVVCVLPNTVLAFMNISICFLNTSLKFQPSTSRAYEKVPWDNMLPPKIQPSESTREMLANPVSQCFTKRRYNPEPEISQVTKRKRDDILLSYFHFFQAPCLHICSRAVICYVLGCAGAIYFEDIDNADVDLIPLNHLQTSKSHHTSPAYTPNIPGYTGKVHWSATHPANSNLPSTTPSVIARMHG